MLENWRTTRHTHQNAHDQTTENHDETNWFSNACTIEVKKDEGAHVIGCQTTRACPIAHLPNCPDCEL